MMKTIPKTDITFFFSDIEQSTHLLHRLGEAYARVLETYRATIREALDQYQGREIDTAGDGFFAIFPDPQRAVAAAVLVQKVFTQEDWAVSAGFRARIGLHQGQCILTDNSCIGLEVHRASRICGLAHGQQILLSETVQEQIREHLPAGVQIKKIGLHKLRGFEESELLYQLVIAGLPAKFPAPRPASRAPTVAVLPFAKLDNTPNEHFFGEGIADEIIIALGKIPGIRVVARSSSFALKDMSLSGQESGRRLCAEAILEGTFRKHNGRLRITAELVDTNSGYNLWSGGFDREEAGLFSVQDEIAEQVAMALKVKLFSGQFRGIQHVQTRDVHAYEFYLQGRRLFLSQFNAQSILSALEMFQRAIEIDSDYALAYCGIANCCSFQYMYLEKNAANLQRARDASRRAIDLDPFLAEAYAAYGLALSLTADTAKQAIVVFERAIELGADLFEAYYFYGRVCFVAGQLEKAGKLFEIANKKRPEDYQSLMLAGQVYADLGQRESSSRCRRKAIEIAAKHLTLNPGDIRALYMGANGLVSLGEKEKGLEWLQRALVLQPNDSMLLYNAGCIYALLDMAEPALACLERAFEKGITQRGWYENDSNLDSLRALPRFQRLLELIP